MSPRDDYTARDITVLEGLAPVRKRPAMYIGGTDAEGLHHLVWEILDNSVDEAMNGHASRIDVTLRKSGELCVTDNGRGIPVDVHKPSGKPAIEVILTTLHAGGKFDRGAYHASGGLHGVGASVVNALSRSLTAKVRRHRRQWEMRFRRGKPVGKLKETGSGRGTGHRDRLPARSRDLSGPEARGKTDRRPDARDQLPPPGSSTDLLGRSVRGSARLEGGARPARTTSDAVVRDRKLTLAHEAAFELSRDPLDGEGRLELVLGWTEAPREEFRS